MMDGEILSMQVVSMKCGRCERDYDVELMIDDEKMVACPHCENAGLQMLVGTE